MLGGKLANNRERTFLPAGRQWLRAAFAKCFEIERPDALTCVVVRNTRPKPNVNSLRKRRLENQTCWEAHPGLCVRDANFSSIRALHAGLGRAIHSFGLDADDANGEALFLFAGFKRKAHADRTLRRFSAERIADGIAGAEFELAFLRDQPDRRKSLVTWAPCRFILTEGVFHMGKHAGLVRSDGMALEHYVSYQFAKRLRDRAKY